MWQVTGKSVHPKRFEPFSPDRVLNYYDGPRIFTFLDADGGLCLACWSDEDDELSRFLVAPVNEEIVGLLEEGTISVREALTQPRLWAVDCGSDGTPKEAWLVNQRDVPEDCQPQPGVMLYPTKESNSQTVAKLRNRICELEQLLRFQPPTKKMENHQFKSSLWVHCYETLGVLIDLMRSEQKS